MPQKKQTPQQQNNQPEQRHSSSNMKLEVRDEELTVDMNMALELENEASSDIDDAIEKALASTKVKPKMIRKNIEHYLEERALKRRVSDVFDDELLLID